MKKLIPIEHFNVRVLTTQQLAESYETDAIKIQQNFNNNKDRYTKGKHYYFLEGDELRAFKDSLENFEVVDKRVPTLYLWTRKGALFHAKSLNNDKAWEVYDALVEDYFRNRESAPQTPADYLSALKALVAAEEEKALLKEQAETLEIALNDSLRFYTVAKYNKEYKMGWSMKACQAIGKKMSAYCRANSIEIRKCETNDERFGSTNSYPLTAWESFLAS